jgi:hypothetical protein
VCVQGCRKKKKRKEKVSFLWQSRRESKEKKRSVSLGTEPVNWAPFKVDCEERESLTYTWARYTLYCSSSIFFLFLLCVSSVYTHESRYFSCPSSFFFFYDDDCALISFLLPFCWRPVAYITNDPSQNSRDGTAYSRPVACLTHAYVSAQEQRKHTQSWGGGRKKKRRRSGRISSICLFAGEKWRGRFH